VAGGIGSSSDPLSSAELYDPATGSWSSTGSLNIARNTHTATLLPNGQVLVAGGGNNASNAAELYNPATGNWTNTGSLHSGHSGLTATLLPSGNVLVAGGSTGNNVPTNTAELYDPPTGTWSPTASLGAARSSHAATLLASGQVLVAGGFSGSGLLSSAELYDSGVEICTVCHKRTLTLLLVCGSPEYQRHLDHGDTLGTCQGATGGK
jgi:hypothetical protein